MGLRVACEGEGFAVLPADLPSSSKSATRHFARKRFLIALLCWSGKWNEHMNLSLSPGQLDPFFLSTASLPPFACETHPPTGRSSDLNPHKNADHHKTGIAFHRSLISEGKMYGHVRASKSAVRGWDAISLKASRQCWCPKMEFRKR